MNARNGSVSFPLDSRSRRRPRPQKTAMLLAQRIVREIVEREHEPGQMLLPEKDMLVEYEVSRGTLREALRFLEMQGVLTIRPGPGGGPTVSSPDARHLASTLALLLELSGTPFRVIVEARQTLEPAMAAMAAERIPPEILTALDDSVEGMAQNLHDLAEFLDENARFHELIAWASGNQLFGYLVTSLHWITDGTALGVDYSPERRKAVLRAHERIVEGIRSGDPDEAAKATKRHIDEFARYLDRNYPSLMEQPLSWQQVSS